MTYRTIPLFCPSCRPRPELVHHDVGAQCKRCAGWFIDEDELLAQIREAQPEHGVGELLEHNDGSPRRPCPACGEAMNIVWLEFLQLDRCDAHGVWLDPGELELALRWDVVPEAMARLKPKERNRGGFVPV